MKVLQRITVPQESVNDQTLLVLELNFANGAKVEKGAMIAELETSKTTISVESEVDGYVQYFCKTGDELQVNAIIAEITDQIPVISEPVTTVHTSPVLPEKFTPHILANVEETIFSKKALEILSTSGLSKDLFKGLDFVGKKEVEFILNGNASAPEKNKGVGVRPPVKAAQEDDLSVVDVKKIGSFKNKEIEYLSQVQSAGLVSIINVFVDAENVTDFLNLHFSYFKDSLLPVIVFESARLLKKFPAFNAYYNHGTIAYYKEVNIGFAVDMGKGLKVLKLPQAEKKTTREIENEIFQLSNAYLDDKLKTENLVDITFTITDLSGEGVFSFTPLINMKNSAILGISAIDKKLKRCVLSLAFDHRVTEGRHAAIFLGELKDRIESYYSRQGADAVKAKRLSSITCYKCGKRLAEDLSATGFAKCVTPDGEEAYICQSCFKGF